MSRDETKKNHSLRYSFYFPISDELYEKPSQIEFSGFELYTRSDMSKNIGTCLIVGLSLLPVQMNASRAPRQADISENMAAHLYF